MVGGAARRRRRPGSSAVEHIARRASCSQLNTAATIAGRITVAATISGPIELGEVADRGRLAGRRVDGAVTHADHERCRPSRSPTAQPSADDREPDRAQLGVDRARPAQARSARRLDSVARRVGRHQRGDDGQRHEPAHDRIDRRPADPLGQDQRQRAADQRRDAIAELVDRREDLDRRLLVGDVDPPGVDHHVLGRRGERADHRDQREPAERQPRVGHRQPEEGRGQQHLADDQPAAPPPEPLQPRQAAPGRPAATTGT